AGLADRLYRLFAIVVHLGSGPNSGHYVSLVRTGVSPSSWKLFDDDTVKSFSESNLSATFGSVQDDPTSVAATQTSYLLFYETSRDTEPTEALEDSFHLIPHTLGYDALEARSIRIASVESRPTAAGTGPSEGSTSSSMFSRPEFASSVAMPTTERFGIPGLA